MSDYSQDVYNAVTQQFRGVSNIVEHAVRSALDGTGHAIESARVSVYGMALGIEREATRPSVLYRPAINIDGDKWCALYGENLQNGVAGFGDSPAEAMAAFDAAWTAKMREAVTR